MFNFNKSKIAFLNKLYANGLASFNRLSSLNREKIIYILIFFSIIFSLFIIDLTNKQIASKQAKVKSQLIENSELIAIKNFIIKNIKSPFTNVSYKVKKGDTLVGILKNYKINNRDINKAITEFKKYNKSSNITSGLKINFTTKNEISSKKIFLERISIPMSKSVSIEIFRNEHKELVSEKIITQLFKKMSLVENKIEKSLYAAAVESKIEPNIIVEFARIYGFEIDFQRDIRKNDTFQILYEKFYDENDVYIKNGKILYAFMSVNNREIALYKFGKDNTYDYFDINGKSVVKALMKTPINGARLSSPFGMRKHPILGFNKMHRGTDFAAPSGTPIMASGTGTIVHARWCGGGGNCIKIKHNSTYSTVYGHLKNFAKGIRAGRKVKQGQIIGYVGSTGMSTGPHLHYEVLVNGKQVNSQTLKLPSGKILKNQERKDFEVHRIKTDVLIAELLSKNN